MSLLKDKVAIVTGASSGIGRAIARRYAAEGAAAVIADIVDSPIEGGPSTVELITGSGGSALYLPTDISDWRAVDALVAAAVGRFGRLDILVNNAATYTSTNLIETTPEQWSRVMAVNVTGFFYCSKRAVMQMLTQHPVDDVRGRIINISSQHGRSPVPEISPIRSAKARSCR